MTFRTLILIYISIYIYIAQGHNLEQLNIYCTYYLIFESQTVWARESKRDFFPNEHENWVGGLYGILICMTRLRDFFRLMLYAWI